jgi:ubiquinone/menaquinone biosynthesis C-methylase UbiE
MSVGEAVPLYDALSDDYDRFVNWESRLAYEMPFIERTLREADARRMIDVACGTGMHAIELVRRGYKVVGADLSASMIEQARENAAATSVEAHFVVAGFGELNEWIKCDFSRRQMTVTLAIICQRLTVFCIIGGKTGVLPQSVGIIEK